MAFAVAEGKERKEMEEGRGDEGRKKMSWKEGEREGRGELKGSLNPREVLSLHTLRSSERIASGHFH